MENSKQDLVRIIKERSFQYSSEPKFKLSSGAVSNFYFNLKQTTQSPDGMYLVGKIMFEKIRELGLRSKAIGGLTMGADPIAYAVAMYSHIAEAPIHAFAIRKEPKQHGMGLQIEGGVEKGDHVIIIDDVVTTGNSTIKAMNIAMEHGLIIDAVIILLDRCEQNGRQNIEKLGCPVHHILDIHDFMPA